MERDPAGSLWALPGTPGPWWATGSHLDSVRGGGRFDGALGVAAGFAAAERVPGVAVIAFADEEGARFNTPTFGSRALAGRLAPDVLARTDDDGMTLRAAMRAFGADPGRSARRRRGSAGCAASSSSTSTRRATSRGSPPPRAPCATWRHALRLAVELAGRADHAGTTRRDERADALAAAARLIVAADALAGDDRDFLVTATRMLVEPNAFTTVPSRVRLWLDARTPDAGALAAWRERADGAGGRARRRPRGSRPRPSRPASRSTPASGPRSATCPRSRRSRGTTRASSPAACPPGMVFVRNATGISHAPDEHVELDDAAVAATALARALEALA